MDADPSPQPPAAVTPERIAAAVERIRRARQFTRQFLADLTPDQWFWSPPQYPTHIAWQVTHVAVSQYALCFRRIRGTLPEDETWCPAEWITRFGVKSEPQPDPAANPPIEEIQRVFDGVFEHALQAIPAYTAEQLSSAVDPPHPAFETKMAAIEFAPHHEAVHAGQIAMLRRLVGKQPLR